MKNLAELMQNLKADLEAVEICVSEMGDQAKYKALEAAFRELLSAAIEYLEYEHNGDPYTEDARVMKEMRLNKLDQLGKIEQFKLILSEIKGK